MSVFLQEFSSSVYYRGYESPGLLANAAATSAAITDMARGQVRRYLSSKYFCCLGDIQVLRNAFFLKFHLHPLLVTLITLSTSS